MHWHKSKAPSTLLVLFYHNQVVIFPFYPKNKAETGRCEGRPIACPPLGDGCSVLLFSTSSQKQMLQLFLHLLRAYSVFDFICGVPRFPDMVFAKKPESDFNAVLFRDISKVHVPRCKKESISRLPISSFHFEAQITFGLL